MSKKPQRRTLDGQYLEAVPPGWPMYVHPLSLARTDCVFCRGTGIDSAGRSKPRICGCAYRAVFRICLHKYLRECTEMRRGVCLEVGSGSANFTRPAAEYMADFLSLGLKRLPTDTHKLIFQSHYLGGNDYKAVFSEIRRKLVPDFTLGQYWHLTYQVAEFVGERCITVQPYRLYPLDEYFGVNTVQALSQVTGGQSTPRTILPMPMLENDLCQYAARSKKNRVKPTLAFKEHKWSMPLAA
jgi:hypothetical protein